MAPVKDVNRHQAQDIVIKVPKAHFEPAYYRKSVMNIYAEAIVFYFVNFFRNTLLR